MAWNFQREEGGFETKIPEGKHRIRIKSAEKTVSKTGKDMLTLQFDISGYNATLYHYIVFLPDKPQITNRNLTQFFDAFPGIPAGDFNTANWVGKVGACTIKHEEYNGNINAKINNFLAADKAADLPAWVEPENNMDSVMNPPDVDYNDIPFPM